MSWKDRARNILKTYYMSFNGTQWHTFDTNKDSELLKIKICYAVFGPPTESKSSSVEEISIEEAYSREQKKTAQEIIKNILKVKREDSSKISIGFAFVFCHQNEKEEFCIPVFSVLVGTKDGKDLRNFVDTHGRTYVDWDDWKNTNCLPKVEIAYPEKGYFTCSMDGSYMFDSQIDPIIEFGKSPQCSAWSTTKKVGDIVSTVTSLGCAGLGVASMFTPLAPVILTVSTIAGGTSAAYGLVRGSGALKDKHSHGQSLKDLESLTLWFSIVATPLHFASSAVTGFLTRGAVQQGRVFSQGTRVIASVLLFTTFGLDTALISFSIYNLIIKAKNKELTTLDVLQFSISVFFFTNTIIQPKTASGVIRKAQSMNFDKVANSMTDETAKKTFNKFLENNKVDGSITDRSKIVRSINRMNDPDHFFKMAGSDPSIDSINIGGRKGKTVIINDQHGYGQRVKPNEFQNVVNVVPSPVASNVTSNKLQKDVVKKVKKGYNRDPSEVELNGKKIFENLDDFQKKDISRKLGGTAKNNSDIIQTAHTIAETMGCQTLEEYLSIVEVVAKSVQGMSDIDIGNTLNNLDQHTFCQGLRSDLNKAEAIAKNGGLTFKDPYKAMYHYRKHGEEFPKIIKKHGNTLNVYLGQVKNHVIDRSNLRETVTLSTGDMKYIYATKSDEYGIVISNPNGGSISTMFYNPGCSAKLPNQFSTSPSIHATIPLNINEAAHLVATNLALPAFYVVLNVNDTKKSISDCDDLSGADHEAIAEFLMSYNDTI